MTTSDKLVPDSPEKWRVTAGTKQKLQDCKISLQKALNLRKMTQDDFMREIADNWPVIQKAIMRNKKAILKKKKV